MKPTWMNFLETATVGVVGRGSHGVASRCVECRSSRQGWDLCSGFGEGCLMKVAPEGPVPAPKGRPPQP
jgi:hypothetical protein